MLKKLINTITAQRHAEREAELYRNLIRREAQIGGQLFGNVTPGGRREFFCLDEHTWVWHEEWTDNSGKRQTKTTRYDVRPDRVVKVQNGQYQSVTDAELLHLNEAAKAYGQRIRSELYSFVN